MAAPVWQLTVDLQTRTAVFQTGLADAARSARTAFTDIGNSARSGSDRVIEGTTDVRHSLGLMDNAIRGNHAAAMVDMIRLFQQSSIVMAAIPFAGVIGGVLLLGSTVVELVRHFQELRMEEEKIKDAQTELGTAINETFNGFDQKLLAAQKQADELSNDHLGALKTELQLINDQSFEELKKSFDAVAKQADEFFGKLKAHWYEFGIGSEGAQHALQEFKVQYQSLLSQKDDKAASGLLHGTLDQAREVLKLQQEANSAKGSDYTDTSYTAQLRLRQEGIGYTKKEMEAQEGLVQALEATVTLEQKRQDLVKRQSGNAVHAEGNEEAARASAAARQTAESMARMGEQSLAAERATAESALTVKRASLEERLSVDLDFAGRERDIQLAANQAEIAALDKAGKDYQNQLKALQEKALEIQNEFDTKSAELRAKESVEASQRDLANFEQSERAKIEATSRGEAERVAAIDSAIKDAEALNLQETDFYRELLTQRVEAVRTEAEEEKKIASQSAEVKARARDQEAKEEARHRIAMLQLQQRGNPSDLARIGVEREQMDLEYALKRASLEEQLALYQQAGAERVRQAQQVTLQLEQLDNQYANHTAELQAQQRQALRASWAEIETGYAHTFMDVLSGHQSLTAAFGRLATEGADKMIAASLQVINGQKSEQLAYAKTAAAGAYKSLAGIPIIGPELGAVAAATVFAGAMAFREGTDMVPGVGRGDIIPTLLEPGEGVVPGGVMDGLRTVARNGGFDRGPSYTVHVRPVYNLNAIDSEGMAAVLTKHSAEISRHVEGAVRRLNY